MRHQGRGADGLGPVTACLQNLTTQQQALGGQVQALARALERRGTDAGAAAPLGQLPVPVASAVAIPVYWGVPSALGFAAAGALAAAAALSLAGRPR